MPCMYHLRQYRVERTQPISGHGSLDSGTLSETPRGCSKSSVRSSRTPTFECNKRVRRAATFVDYCGVRPAHFLRHYTACARQYFLPSHTLPLITHTNTPPVTNHAQDRSHVPLEPRRRSPHPCKSTARFSKPTARRPKKHQTPNTKPPDQST